MEAVHREEKEEVVGEAIRQVWEVNEPTLEITTPLAMGSLENTAAVMGGELLKVLRPMRVTEAHLVAEEQEEEVGWLKVVQAVPELEVKYESGPGKFS